MIDTRQTADPLVPAPPTLRDHTPARVALASTGSSLTTRHALEFALAQAQARDAVHSTLDLPTITSALEARTLPQLTLHSAARDRATYLRRPDLGRTLSPASVKQIATRPLEILSFRPDPERPRASEASRRGAEGEVEKPATLPPTTLTIILADGLSATATNRHAIPLLDELLPLVPTFHLTPIVIAQQARVALADEIGAALHADITLILLGERPGLSSPDSLGAYITWAPRPGRTDAERNCVSNIRPPLNGQAGLDYPTAARKIAWFLSEARRLALTGITLRESSPAALP